MVLFFAVIYLTGFWLTRSGRPYGAALFNIHKLVSLAAFIFLIVVAVQVNKAVGLNASGLTSTIVTGVFFIATIVSGGLLSAVESAPAVVRLIHWVAPFLTTVSTAATLYLLLVRK